MWIELNKRFQYSPPINFQGDVAMISQKKKIDLKEAKQLIIQPAVNKENFEEKKHEIDINLSGPNKIVFMIIK